MNAAAIASIRSHVEAPACPATAGRRRVAGITPPRAFWVGVLLGAGGVGGAGLVAAILIF